MTRLPVHFLVLLLVLVVPLEAARQQECAELVGSWKLDRMEGLEALMDYEQVGGLSRSAGRVVNSFVSSEISLDDTDTWTIEYTLVKMKTLSESFKLGERYTASKPLGETMSGASTIENGKLVSKFEQANGDLLIQTREVTPSGQLLWELTVPGTAVNFTRWLNRA